MAVEVSTAVWAGAQDFEGGTLLVLLRLADWANIEGVCWPSISKLAAFCRMSERQVQRILRKLEADHVLEVEQRGDQHKANVYRIVVSNLSAARVTSETKGDICDTGRVTSETGRVTPVSPHPSGEPSIEPSLPPRPTRTEAEIEAERFVEWFLDLLRKTGAPEPRMTPTIRSGWADAYEKLRRIDGKEKAEIARVCEWARGDVFWKTNFFAPTKLRERKDGVSRYDMFLSRSKLNGTAPHQRPNSRFFANAETYPGFTDK